MSDDDKASTQAASTQAAATLAERRELLSRLRRELEAEAAAKVARPPRDWAQAADGAPATLADLLGAPAPTPRRSAMPEDLADALESPSDALSAADHGQRLIVVFDRGRTELIRAAADRLGRRPETVAAAALDWMIDSAIAENQA